ncbi:MAG: nucleotide sugar dehydrogenase [Lentisphaeria bacterium]|nr:nucleotide sugar dehydrogenase [Lentisphaeria bacterium]
MKKITNIVCIGAGYVGGPTMAMIAAKCPSRRVTVVDINPSRIAAWNAEELPFFEPGLREVVDSAIGRNLFFSTDIPGAIRDADLIFVSVNTPTKTFGAGAGYASDLQYWEKTAREILEYSEGDKIVVEKSTLPVRTAAAMQRVLQSNKKGLHFEVLSNPEFLAEGTAIRDLENPDRVLIGSDETGRGLEACEALVDIYAEWVPRERILTTNVWSAELSKVAANAFLAQRISSINALSGLCEETGADITEVERAIGGDSRIGPKFLRAGIGFGGSCFRKDILNLVYMCESCGLHEEAEYWKSVVTMNEHQCARFVKNMLKQMFDTISGKRIAILGFAFKADTSDTRDTPALKVARLLVDERADVVISDPYALENARCDLAELGERVNYEADPYEAVKNADAVAVLTDWKGYRELDWQRVFAAMRQPAFLFDGRNCLDHDALFDLGFQVYAIGKKGKSHF